jgi:cyanophycinase
MVNGLTGPLSRILRLFKSLCIPSLVAGLLLFVPQLLDDELDGPTLQFLTSRAHGTLVICGGGDISDDVMYEFIDAAGGDEARVVVVTTASETADSDEIEDELEFWEAQTLARLTVLHTRSRETADDPEFARPLADASGVWFIGGNQAWLADTYLGTICERMIHGVLQRGGVVGGTSAGAAVMSSVMIRDGKTRPETGPGFGLLPGTVIDQHFLARNRQERLLGALAAHPGLLGLGIDEGAAVVIRDGRLSVVGDSTVVIYIAPSPDSPPTVATYKPGEQATLLKLGLRDGKSRKSGIPFRLAASDSSGGD